MVEDVKPCGNKAPHDPHYYPIPGTIPDPAYVNECPGVLFGNPRVEVHPDRPVVLSKGDV